MAFQENTRPSRGGERGDREGGHRRGGSRQEGEDGNVAPEANIFTTPSSASGYGRNNNNNNNSGRRRRGRDFVSVGGGGGGGGANDGNEATTIVPKSQLPVYEQGHPDAELWEDIGLRDDILRGIFGIGFDSPSPIQSKAIFPMICGCDLIAQAQSGTGKTGTFTVGTLQRVDPAVPHCQAIIMLPTHELVTQVHHVLTEIGKYMTGLHVKTLVGGPTVEEDAEDIRRQTPHIVVGCPGRVFDILKRRYLNHRHVRLLAIDEADKMLSNDFKDQIQQIFTYLPDNMQTCIFSATMPPEMLELTNRFMVDPVRITVKAEQLTLQGIRQFFVALRTDDEKYTTIKDILSQVNSMTIVYCNSVKRVAHLVDAMRKEGFLVGGIHRNMTREERTREFESFRKCDTRILISSDLTARGIDVQQVSLVINFDVCRDVNTYLHRIGRSGRWGRKGVAINFMTPMDVNTMGFIERHYHTEVQELPEDFEKFLS